MRLANQIAAWVLGIYALVYGLFLVLAVEFFDHWVIVGLLVGACAGFAAGARIEYVVRGGAHWLDAIIVVGLLVPLVFFAWLLVTWLQLDQAQTSFDLLILVGLIVAPLLLTLWVAVAFGVFALRSLRAK